MLRTLPKVKPTYAKRLIAISAPPIFSLSRNYVEVMAFIYNARRYIYEHYMAKTRSSRSKRQLRLDLSTITQIGPAAALVLAAELDRWRLLTGAKLMPYRLQDWDPTVRAALLDLGLFDLLSVEAPEHDPDTLPTTRLIKFMSGTGAAGDDCLKLRDALQDVAGPIQARTYLYDGISEAMTNSMHHAYPIGQEDLTVPHAPGKRWWASGSFNAETGVMKAMVYDQGVGIPSTLPSSRFWEKIVALTASSGRHDAYMIKAALEVDRTSTEEPGRGQGLSNVKAYIDNSDEGLLRIWSGKGHVSYSKGGKIATVAQTTPFSGTLLEWEVSRGRPADGE